jgi:hypothetical protein
MYSVCRSFVTITTSITRAQICNFPQHKTGYDSTACQIFTERSDFNDDDDDEGVAYVDNRSYYPEYYEVAQTSLKNLLLKFTTRNRCYDF